MNFKEAFHDGLRLVLLIVSFKFGEQIVGNMLVKKTTPLANKPQLAAVAGAGPVRKSDAASQKHKAVKY